jgi:hypothetical protein
MVAFAPRAEMVFAGSSARCAYVELKNVGTFGAADVEALSRLLCDELATALGVPRDRIYIEFTGADGALWGWNGETFG